MTRVATRNIHRRAQIVLMRQILPQFHLIGIALSVHLNRQGCRWLLVAHIKDLLPRPQVLLWSAMTLNTPLHLQRRVIKHQWHAVHRPVASVAAYALIDMNTVIEINKVRKIIYPVPHQRLSGAITFAHGFEQRRCRPDLPVAIHAGLRRRDAGEAGSLHRSVAVAAIDSKRRHVVLVAERRRLWPRYARIGHVGRPLEIHASPQSKGKRKYSHINRSAGNYISAAMENLHRSGFFLQRNLHCDPSLVAEKFLFVF